MHSVSHHMHIKPTAWAPFCCEFRALKQAPLTSCICLMVIMSDTEDEVLDVDKEDEDRHSDVSVSGQETPGWRKRMRLSQDAANTADVRLIPVPRHGPQGLPQTPHMPMSVAHPPSPLARRSPFVYDPNCCGTPGIWHSRTLGPWLPWGKTTRKALMKIPHLHLLHPSPPPICIGSFLQFLKARVGPCGSTVDTYLGSPEAYPLGWYRFPFIRPRTRLVGGTVLFHATHISCLYSILYHGDLGNSIDGRNGQRSFDGVAGAYFFEDRSITSYHDWHHFGAGVCWCAVIEVLADRSACCSGAEKHQNSKHKQRIQPSGTFSIEAVWACGYHAQQFCDSTWIHPYWFPQHEGNPLNWER